MKLQRQLSMGKLSSAMRDLLADSVIVEKCRELWAGLCVATHRPADDDDYDYFTGSYEFSCTTTPVNVLKTVKGPRRRQRRLPPCIGAKQATEMQAGTIVVTRRDVGWSPGPERSPQAVAALDIDGLAEEFIQRFREQLRMQVEIVEQEAKVEIVEQKAKPKARLARSASVM